MTKLTRDQLRDFAYHFTTPDVADTDCDAFDKLPLAQRAYIVGYKHGRIDSACIRVMGAPIREIMARKPETAKPQTAWADFCDALKEPGILAVRLLILGSFGVTGYFFLSAILDFFVGAR